MAKPAPHYKPQGMHTITAHLWFNGKCEEALMFYQKAMGAELLTVVHDKSGKNILHALLKIGESHLMMADAWPGSEECGPKEYASAGLWLYVENSDDLHKQALEQGCKEVMPQMDTFWGDRMGKVKDPFGHHWALATYKVEMTKEEIKKGQDEWEKNMSSC